MVALSSLTISILLYQICTSLLVMLFYCIFLLFELYDPIWVFVDRKWLLTIMISVIAILLNSNGKWRVITAFLGIGMGEILYAYVLYTTDILITITNPTFLDIGALIGVTILLWNGLEKVIHHLNKLYDPQTHLEKEKQRLG
ncbi:hypothetical protein GCM10008967_42170 [Bacillus carboniphilus]|uniref:Uncharacterized protein n=2 Tax=Bacillus carboniphilus TaxID=86663 RepID=A0ABN0WV04_9BACI